MGGAQIPQRPRRLSLGSARACQGAIHGAGGGALLVGTLSLLQQATRLAEQSGMFAAPNGNKSQRNRTPLLFMCFFLRKTKKDTTYQQPRGPLL